ncbi:molybdopterin-dependent oxidoreductase [Actinomycetospora sp. TBRC 11914]|nr:molybdopterin-dependent oxidoreductase [Actinomycetospora sp. TBRC 11914]
MLAVALALGVGDLVAALVSPPSSPLLAVGDQAIRLTPEWLKDAAVGAFGVHDKQVLLAGMAVVITGVAVAGGLASRRSPFPALALVVVLGLVSVTCALAEPSVTPAYLVAPCAALVAGAAAAAGLHALARRAATARVTAATAATGTARAVRADDARRHLLLGMAAALVGAGITGYLGRRLAAAAAVEASRDAVGPLPTPAAPPAGADFASSGGPRWLTANADFYRIDTALQVPQLSTADYRLRIHGLVDREIVLDYDDLRRRARLQAPVTLTCVSNEVGGDLVSNAVFVGVPLRDLLAEAGVHDGGDQIASTSVDGFTTGTPVAACTDGRDAMLALGMNGQPLPIEHGFPVRMVVPGLYGYVSACKWITDMELTTYDAFQSYWQQRGWSARAPIKTQSRIDVPRDGARVPAGRVTVAGTAWAQHRGIVHVEVRADAGPWQTAELATDVSVDTWRMWRAVLVLPPGARSLQVRATDATGATQDPTPAPPDPDGATGWHTVAVTAV